MAQTRSTEHLDKGAYLILESTFHRCEWFTFISSSGGRDSALWKRSPLENKSKKHSFFFFLPKLPSSRNCLSGDMVPSGGKIRSCKCVFLFSSSTNIESRQCIKVFIKDAQITESFFYEKLRWSD